MTMPITIVVDGRTFESGLPISAKMLVPPEEWPIRVTRSGSPPKARMCFYEVVVYSGLAWAV